MLILSWASRLTRRSLKTRSGLAAKGGASALSTRTLRSGTRLLPDPFGPVFQAGEEPIDLLPHCIPAREPAPSGPDDAHELVALVDRRLVIPRTSSAPRAIDEERFHIRLQLLKTRVLAQDLV